MKIRTILLIAGLAVLNACTTAPVPANFGIQLRSQVVESGDPRLDEARLIVSGTGFTPGGTAEINIFGWPKFGDLGPFHKVVDSTGSFSQTTARPILAVPRDQEIAPIRVTVRDVSSGRAAADSTSGIPFVRRR
jgi:hypothetical protein